MITIMNRPRLCLFICRVSILTTWAVFSFSHQAAAYIDPNAGGILFQAAFPLLSGLLGLLTLGRKKMKEVYRRITGRMAMLWHGRLR